jgi:flagellar biosynthesis protein FlhF
MEIKTYRAGSIHEALEMIRYDLGSDAVVLGTREVRPGGLFGLLSAPRYWELKAAVGLPVLGPWLQSVGPLDRGIDLSRLGASTISSASD